MNNNDFELKDGKVYSTVSGDLLATIDDDGNVKMQQGKNALTPRVKAFLATAPQLPVAEASENPEADAALEQITENPDFSNALPDDEEVNTHVLSESDEHIFFGDAPRHGTGLPAVEENTPSPAPDALSVYDIPESALPAFDPALGTASPEVKSFVRKHKFNKVQSAELIRRLEKKLAVKQEEIDHVR